MLNLEMGETKMLGKFSYAALATLFASFIWGLMGLSAAAPGSIAPPAYDIGGKWILQVDTVLVNEGTKPPTECDYTIKITAAPPKPFYPPWEVTPTQFRSAFPPSQVVAAPPPASAPTNLPTTAVMVSFTAEYADDDAGKQASLQAIKSNKAQGQVTPAMLNKTASSLPPCAAANMTGYPVGGTVGNYGYNAKFSGTAWLLSTLQANAVTTSGVLVFNELVPYDPSITAIIYSAGHAAGFLGTLRDSGGGPNVHGQWYDAGPNGGTFKMKRP
jgi:hypothetical protein